MSNNPLVSIITVVFNGSKTLEQTIKSVLNQSYNNVEYIIIDGGSTDGSIDIIKKYEVLLSFWVSETDFGLYHAMNKGISLAKGELIAMINSDDWYELNAVKLVVDSYNLNPSKKIFHGDRFDVVNNTSKVVYRFNPSEFKFLYLGMTYNHPSFFVHKEIYKEKSYDIKLKSLSDYQFTLSFFLYNKNLFYYIPIPYVNYRLDGISSKLSIIEALYEGFYARKNARLCLYKNIISVVLRFIYLTIFKPIIRIRFKNYFVLYLTYNFYY